MSISVVWIQLPQLQFYWDKLNVVVSNCMLYHVMSCCQPCQDNVQTLWSDRKHWRGLQIQRYIWMKYQSNLILIMMTRGSRVSVNKTTPETMKLKYNFLVYLYSLYAISPSQYISNEIFMSYRKILVECLWHFVWNRKNKHWLLILFFVGEF